MIQFALTHYFLFAAIAITSIICGLALAEQVIRFLEQHSLSRRRRYEYTVIESGATGPGNMITSPVVRSLFNADWKLHSFYHKGNNMFVLIFEREIS